MKRKPILTLLLSLFIFFIIFLPTFVMAQGGGPGGPGGSGDPACDPLDNTDDYGNVCPIDSNVYILLAIGVVYGIKKVKERKTAEVAHKAKGNVQ